MNRDQSGNFFFINEHIIGFIKSDQYPVISCMMQKASGNAIKRILCALVMTHWENVRRLN